MYEYEQAQGPENQPTSDNAFLDGNEYHEPDRTKFSGMNIIDMRMHMNFETASNAFSNGKDSDDSVNDATYNAVYVDSHDYGPGKSPTRYDGGTDAWAENMSLMWTFRGIPTLYYGSEIEFQAGEEIDCGPSCPLAETGRAYYGDHLEGEVTASGFGTVGSASGEVAETLDQPLVQHVQRLNQIRRAVPALQSGQYSTEGGVDGGEMAFKRRYTTETSDSFALVTVSGAASFTGIPDGTYVDAVTGDERTVTDGTLDISALGRAICASMCSTSRTALLPGRSARTASTSDEGPPSSTAPPSSAHHHQRGQLMRTFRMLPATLAAMTLTSTCMLAAAQAASDAPTAPADEVSSSVEIESTDPPEGTEASAADDEDVDAPAEQGPFYTTNPEGGRSGRRQRSSSTARPRNGHRTW